MNGPIDYRILKNFAGGKYSLNDFKLVTRWFEDKTNEVELKNAILQHWNEFSDETEEIDKDLSVVLNQLRKKIAAEKPVVNFRIRLQKVYTRAAAILLVPLLLYSVYSTFLNSPSPENPTAIEIVSPQGARTRFELPDGTQGWLNSGSSLKYTTNYLKKRAIELQGEAWFDVIHNKKKPFIVHTAALNVEVLGTKFNVAAFPEDKITEVVLQDGKVKVNGIDKIFSSEMVPDEKFTYDKDLHTSTIQTVNAGQFSAWKDGLLVFRNEPLSEVLKRVGRWYNVEIVLDDPELAKFRYRATFQEEQIEEVIRLISLTAPIEYSFNDREVDAAGIFKKRSITVRRKI